MNHTLAIELNSVMYAELVDAARECSGETIMTPEMFALQAVESVLASRRLKRMCPGE